MRVLFLHQQPCMRALKYAVGLRAVRPELELGFAYRGRTLTEFYGTGDELFDRWWRLGDDLAAGLDRVIAGWEPDLIHSHNLPDLLTVLALDATAGPSSTTCTTCTACAARRTRTGSTTPATRTSSSGRRRGLCGPDHGVGRPARRAGRALRPATAHARAPELRALARLAGGAPRARRRPPRIVYQGTLSCGGGHYDLREIFEAITAQGIALDVFPAREQPAYRQLAGVTVHDPLPPAELMRRLPAMTSAGPASTPRSTRPTSTPRCRTRRSSTWAAGCPSSRSTTARSRGWSTRRGSASCSTASRTSARHSPSSTCRPCAAAWRPPATASRSRGTWARSSSSTTSSRDLFGHPLADQPSEVGEEALLLVRGVGCAHGVHQQPVEARRVDPLEHQLFDVREP